MPLVLVDLLSYTGTKGGMETFARELYSHLGTIETDYQFVGLASTEFMTMDHSWFPGRVIGSGISGENRFSWAYGELFAVARWAKKLDVDLIHSPATLGPMFSAMPTILTVHDLLYFSHPKLMSTGLYTRPVRWMEKRASRNAARIMTDSEASASDIRKYLKYPADRLEVVLLAGTPQKTNQRRAPEPGGLILATGNRRPHKNWAGLVRAMALVPIGVRPKLVVTGSRGDDPLRPIVDELSLHDWVELKSWVSSEELEDLYARATAVAMPSFCDGFCLPALDAMMSGIPVIISDIPVYREVTGDAALYFDPHNLQTIADAVVAITTDATLVASVTAKGFDRAKLFSWEKVSRDVLSNFATAIAAGPRR